jgi:hypothetical protein
VDAVIFDFDGTILDSEWPVYRAIAEQYEAHGHQLTVERWQERVGTDDDLDWFAEIEAHTGRPLDRSAVDAARRARRDVLLAREGVRDGVEPLLDACVAAGVAVAIASSRSRRGPRTRRGHRGLAPRTSRREDGWRCLCGRAQPHHRDHGFQPGRPGAGVPGGGLAGAAGWTPTLVAVTVFLSGRRPQTPSPCCSLRERPAAQRLRP